MLVDTGVGLYMCWLIQVSDYTCVGLSKGRSTQIP